MDDIFMYRLGMKRGGGSGGVSSWNDLTDKPFYEESGMVEVLAETMLDMTDGGILELPYLLGLTVGKTYFVKWRGVEYESVARSVDGGFVVIGSYIDGLDADKPYVFIDKAHNTDVVANDEYTDAMCSITTEGTTIHKLDNRYLDLDWLPTMVTEYVEYIPAYITNTGANVNIFKDVPTLIAGNKYRITFDGVEYECVAKDYAPDVNEYVKIGVGNEEYKTGGGTGEPFFLLEEYAVSEGRFGVILYVTEWQEEHLVSVEVGEKVPDQLPVEFLPNGTPYVQENTLLAETNAMSFTHPTFGQMWAVYGGVPNLKVGETYTITYNATEYKCVCQTAPAGLINDSNAVAMGNFSPVGGENTGEPFAMLVSYEYQEVDIIDLASSTAVKVKISEFTAASETYLSSPNGTIFKITVSDDGTLSATAI